MTHRDVDLPADAKRALDALALLSGKWQPTVLAVLAHHGPLGFNELLDAVPEVSGKVLTETLERLQEADLVERTVVSESPLRVEYDLTPAGEGIDAVFDRLAAWGARHLDGGEPTVVLADGDRRLTDMYGRWLDDRYDVVRAHSRAALEARVADDPDVVVFAGGTPGVDPAGVPSSAPDYCRTIMLVEERPDFDLLGIECDAFLQKPVVRERLLEAVESQLASRGESDRRRERASLAAKRSLLESVYAPETLASDDDYETLCARLETLDDRIED